MNKKHINLKELCALLEVNQQTIYRYVRERKIPFKKRFSKLFFNVEEIDAWISEGIPDSAEVKVL